MPPPCAFSSLHSGGWKGGESILPGFGQPRLSFLVHTCFSGIECCGYCIPCLIHSRRFCVFFLGGFMTGGLEWRFQAYAPCQSSPPPGAVSPALATSIRARLKPERISIYYYIILALSAGHAVNEGHVSKYSSHNSFFYLAVIYALRCVGLSVFQSSPHCGVAGVHSIRFYLLARTWADDHRFPCSIIPSHSTRVLHSLATSSNPESRPRYRQTGNQASQIPTVEAYTAPSILPI